MFSKLRLLIAISLGMGMIVALLGLMMGHRPPVVQAAELPQAEGVGVQMTVRAIAAASPLGPVVDTASDENDGECVSDCSLRDALYTAQAGQTVTFTDDYTIYLSSALHITKEVTVDGSGRSITISGDTGGDGDRDVQLFTIGADGVVTLSHLSLVSGTTPGGVKGAAISNMGRLLLEYSAVADSFSPGGGGGLYNDGATTINHSTFSGNSSGAGGSAVFNDGNLEVNNSTFSGNETDSNGSAFVNRGGLLTVTHSTIVSNTADLDGNGGQAAILSSAGGTTLLRASIVAANVVSGSLYHTNADCSYSGSTFIDGGYNLVGSGTGCPSNSGTTQTVDPTLVFDTVLSPLGNYGGETQTHALLAASPAIDAIPSGSCTLTTDQREVSRPGSGSNFCDIGAYEVSPVFIDLAISKAVSSGAAVSGETITYSLTFSNTGTGTASGAVITDFLPAEITVLNVISSGDVAITRTTIQTAEVFETSAVSPDESGVITITGILSNPLAAGTRFTNTATITTTAGDSDTTNNSAKVGLTVNNVAPVLATIDHQTISETETLTFTASAMDNNGDTLTYSLSGEPGGAAIGSSSGIFSWMTDENDGPDVYTVTIIVSDGVLTDSGYLTDSETITISVAEVNTAPVLAAIGDKSIQETRTLSFTLSATDTDLPANSLTYSMNNGPDGAGLDANSGFFSWTPTYTQGPGTYQVTFIVNDDGSPVLTDSGYLTDSLTITITVSDRLPDLTIAKMVSPATADPGDTITYTLTFANAGDLVAENVAITDFLPAEITVQDVISSGDVAITRTTVQTAEVFETSAVSPGDGGVITITAQLSNNLSKGIFTNTATITTTSVDSDTSNNTANVGVSISCSQVAVVQNSNDSGPGSLRQALADLCDGGSITFGSDTTIYLNSTLNINKNSSIDGSGHRVTISGDTNDDGSGNVRVFEISSGINVTLSYLNIVKGRVTTIEGGGAIRNSGNLTVNYCTFRDNFSKWDGGAICHLRKTLTINNSTFINNKSGQHSGGAVANGESGKGILYVNNSTFANNSAKIDGGAIYSSGDSGNRVYLNNSTFSGNSASSGAAIYRQSGQLHLKNIIMANNNRQDCNGRSSLINSLIDDGSCNPTSSADPLLAPLGDYGGSTETFALLPGSPAIDAGDNATCETTDQRGKSRLNTCDIGAFESQGFALTLAGGDNQATYINTTFAQPLAITVTANLVTEPVGPGGNIIMIAPGNGASLTSQTLAVTTTGDGFASATATANSTAGSYVVTVQAIGAGNTPAFTLTNNGLPDLVLKKTVNSNTANPGHFITYTLAFFNAGDFVADNIVITDTLPAEISVQNVISSGDVIVTRTLSNQTFEVFETSKVSPGQSGFITITAQLSSSLSAGIFTNTATITTTSVDSNTGNNSAQVGVTVAVVDLAITKTVELANSPAIPGEPITYTIVLLNKGDADATNVTVQDALPDSLSGDNLNQTVTVTAGEVLTFTLEATLLDVAANYSTTILNTAGYSHASGSGSDTAGFTTISDTVAPTFGAGALITPSGTIYVKRPTFQWQAANDALSGVAYYTLKLESISSTTTLTSAQTSYTPTVDLSLGVYTWTVRAHDEVGNASAYITPAEVFTIATMPAPNLSITKTVEVSGTSVVPGFAVPGQPITYTIVVANNGDADATNVTVQDTLPTGISGADLNETVTITANASLTFTLSTVVINSAANYTATITNTATFSHTSGDGQAGAAFKTISDTTAPTFGAGSLITPTGTISHTKRPVFRWKAATDSVSGVAYYTLKMASSNNSISLQEATTTITTTQTSFTPTVDLDNGVYTWTVKAHDVAGNVSDYVTPPVTFTLSAGSSTTSVYLPIVVKNN